MESIKKIAILACMKIIQKTFSYCLKPTTLQKKLFAQYAGCARFVYNYGLGLIKKAFDQKTAIPTYEDIANLLPQLKGRYYKMVERGSFTNTATKYQRSC